MKEIIRLLIIMVLGMALSSLVIRLAEVIGGVLEVIIMTSYITILVVGLIISLYIYFKSGKEIKELIRYG